MDSLYFNKEGQPISHDEWASLFEDWDYRIVARDEIPTRQASGERVTARVSTVWLGINYRYDDSGPPIIFETMVFEGALDGEMWRYDTEQAALAGHIRAVEMVKAEI